MTNKKSNLLAFSKRILVLDGAMGTMIQEYELKNQILEEPISKQIKI